MGAMIRVNDDPFDWNKGMTVAKVLEICGFVYHSLIVKVNGRLVKPKHYETHEIPDEADIRVIHMMTGG